MPVTEHTLTYDFADITGDALDPRHTVAWVETNVDGDVVVDTGTSGKVLAGAKVIVSKENTATAGTVDLPTTAGATNPTGFQYRVWLMYRTVFGGKVVQKRWNSGWFSFTSSANLKDIIAAQYVPPTYASTLMTQLDDHESDLEDDLTAHKNALQSALTQAGLGNFDEAATVLAEDEGSDFRDALNTAFDERGVTTYQPTAPNIGIRSDAFILRSSDDGDQSAALSAFLADTNLAGKRRIIGHAEIANTVTVPAGTWVDMSNGVLEQTAAAKKAITIAGDDVRLIAPRIVGRHTSATAAADEYGIYAAGASAASPLRGLYIESSDISLVGMYGGYFKYLDDFEINAAYANDLGYAGLLFMSCVNGRVSDPRSRDILAGFAANGYGIAFSRAESDSLVTDPHCAHIVVDGGIMRNIPWEGYDTHGGVDITFLNPQAYGCKTGIMIGESDNTAEVSTFAPKDIKVIGGTIDSLVNDGSAGPGIYFVGCPGATSSDPAVDYATGSIVGTTVKRHGTQSSATSGAILARNTKGLKIIGADMIEPSPYGVTLYYDNRQAVILGTNVMDAWSNTQTDPSAIASKSANNVDCGVVVNTITTGSKAATYKNARGLNISGSTSTFNTHGNNFAAATTAITGTGASATFSNPLAFPGGTSTSPVKVPNGTAAAPALAFSGDTTTGIFANTIADLAITIANSMKFRFGSAALSVTDGYDIALGATTGTKLGTSPTHKLGHYNATPVVQPNGVTPLKALTDTGLLAAGVEAVAQTPTFPAAQTVSWASGSLAYVTLTGNLTSLTFTNGATSSVYELHIIQDGTGGRTLSGVAANIKFAGGTPTLTATAGKRDVFRFRYDGTNYYEIGRTLNV